MKKKEWLARGERIRALREQGLSISEIVAETDACVSSVLRWTKGVPSKRGRGEGRPKLYGDTERNRRFFVAWENAERGMRRDIATRFGFEKYGTAQMHAYRIRHGDVQA